MAETFVTCKFREGDTRSYTYAYSGAEELAPGDLVKVPDRSGDGWKRVIVDQVDVPVPPYRCKAIIGKYTEPEEER